MVARLVSKIISPEELAAQLAYGKTIYWYPQPPRTFGSNADGETYAYWLQVDCTYARAQEIIDFYQTDLVWRDEKDKISKRRLVCSEKKNRYLGENRAIEILMQHERYGSRSDITVLAKFVNQADMALFLSKFGGYYREFNTGPNGFCNVIMIDMIRLLKLTPRSDNGYIFYFGDEPIIVTDATVAAACDFIIGVSIMLAPMGETPRAEYGVMPAFYQLADYIRDNDPKTYERLFG